jgi:Tol biopolymer transport system component/tRNA A-37 threonylcarbamoyl transferase component Bud32
VTDPIARLNAALAGRYKIERKLGEGGMASVYLAQDLKHDRRVAIKVLRPELAAVVGAERFVAEIRTTANLRHPHILPLFDSGEAGGFLYYVMPYVEGESLRERLDKDKQLPVDDAVAIATKVAAALQAAHDAGVIHRDIKPANILLEKGEPVVADFGIALAVEEAGGGRLTETGLSLGTPYYMSPEQATGDAGVGPTADVYALGCVLFEMLTGEPPFTGASAQAVIGKILSSEPASVRESRPSTPLHVESAVRKCLERLPADRFGSSRALAAALANPAFRYGSGGAQVTGQGAVNTGLAAATVVLAVVVGWLLLRPQEAPTSGPVRSYSLALEQGREPSLAFDVSKDGRLLAATMLVETEGVELFVRGLDELEPRRLPGTAPGGTPAISPDGSEIVYYAGEELRLVSVEGGEPRRLTDAYFDRPDWGPDGTIYFVTPDHGLARIPREGGEPVILTTPEPGAAHRSPHLVEEANALLFTELQRTKSAEIRSLDLATGEVQSIIAGASPTVTPSGHLLFGTSEGLMAVGFDADRLEVVGTPVPLIPNVTSSDDFPRPYYRISDDGLLVYWTGGFADDEFVWVDRQGAARPVERGWSFVAGNANQGWDLSPDGRSIVFRAYSEGGYDLWVKEIDGGPPSRLTFDPAPDERPRWSPDGQAVTFVSSRDSAYAAWQVRADGTGEPERLLSWETGVSSVLWAPDGERVVFRTLGQANTRGGRDVLMVRPGVEAAPSPVSAGSGEETGPEVSPDGRWIAYVSDETGRLEVFVRPFPEASAGRWQVSSAGGTMPLWANNGREMFYVDLDHRVVGVTIDTARGFRVTGERVLFELDASFATATYRWTSGLWDITPEDDRFLMVRTRQLSQEDRPQLIVVENFFHELERRVPGP